MKAMKIKATVNIDMQDIKDVICAGIEGGIDHWAQITLVQRPSGTEKVCTYEVPFFEGGELVICDQEDLNEKGLLNLKTIEKGLTIMADRFPWHFENLIKDNADAETGDVLIQLAVWGDIVFG